MWLQKSAAFEDKFLQLACHKNVGFDTRFIVCGMGGCEAE